MCAVPSCRRAWRAGLFLCLAAAAARADQLDEVVVTSSPFRSSVDDVVQPVSVLAGDALHLASGRSLGETLAHQPGLTATYFGPAASRPVIRGLGGQRVQVLEDGVAAFDVSSLSEDHAVSTEDAVARQLEVLKGPATLLYGNGAVGGAVNTVTRRIPETRIPNGLAGTLELKGDSASRERSAVGTLDGSDQGVGFHADAYDRRTQDVAVPGGRIWNSASRGNGGSFGGSLIGDAGFIGASISRFDDHYGIPQAAPNPASSPHIDMRQDRVALRAAYNPDGGPVDALRFTLTHGDYAHAEVDAQGIVGTRFAQAGDELRVTADHHLGGLKGTVGAQYRHVDFAALGSETFVPPSVARSVGAFAFEQYPLERITFEGGLRVEQQSVTPDAASKLPATSGTTLGGALGALWRVGPSISLAANVTRSERQPAALELYADGAHDATHQYLLGSTALRTEAATSIDLGLRGKGRLDWSLSLYRNAFDNFIYLAPTPRVTDALPVFEYRQSRATLEGFEAEAETPLVEGNGRRLTLRLAADAVRGQLADGADLPQIPPLRVGAELQARIGDWNGEISIWHHLRQDAIAPYESATAGYTLLGATLSRRWQLEHGSLLGFVNAGNLGDVIARRHSSPLKDIAPLPGRSVTVGLRLEL
jgi:iron complex outermembrane receptor protein